VTHTCGLPRPKAFRCVDCEACTACLGEYYMVHGSLWLAAGMSAGMLCIVCLEVRIGRELTPSEFPSAAINVPENAVSARLVARLTGNQERPPAARALTPRQFEIFGFLKASLASTGLPPTRSEIARHFGFASLNAAECHLRAIADKGYLTLTPNISRGIRIVDAEHG
jgi:hypothetical protein